MTTLRKPLGHRPPPGTKASEAHYPVAVQCPSLSFETPACGRRPMFGIPLFWWSSFRTKIEGIYPKQIFRSLVYSTFWSLIGKELAGPRLNFWIRRGYAMHTAYQPSTSHFGQTRERLSFFTTGVKREKIARKKMPATQTWGTSKTKACFGRFFLTMPSPSTAQDLCL